MRHLKCVVCGSYFEALRKDASTCSGACRIQKSRAVKSGQGRGWYAVRPIYVQCWESAKELLPDTSIEAVEGLLASYGAGAVEYAIAAVIEAINHVNQVNREIARSEK